MSRNRVLFSLAFCFILTCVPAQSSTLRTQTLYCGLWRSDKGFSSTISVKNSLVIGPLTVTPVLVMADGTEYSLSPILLPTAGVATININQALQKASQSIGPHVSQFGSAALRYQYATPGEVLGSIEILDTSQSLSFAYSFEGVLPMSSGAHTLEGLWWKHDEGIDGFVSLANVTDQPLSVALRAIGEKGDAASTSSVALPPHATKLLDLDDVLAALPDDESNAGGISISYSGPLGALIASGGLENDAEGYSAVIRFSLHDQIGIKPQPMTFASVGLMAGKPDLMMSFPSATVFTPYMVFRNTSAKSLTLNLSINYMQAGKPVSQSVPSITLRAGEAMPLHMKEMLAALGLGGFNGSLNLVFSFTGAPGDLLVASGSTDQTGDYVFEVLPDNTTESLSKDMPFWSVANGDDTMYTVWNPSNQAQDITFTFYYADGSGHYTLPLHLGPRASAMVDVMMLIEMQQPDADGNLFSMRESQGSAVIASAKGVTEPMTMSASTGIFNVRAATCRVPTCESCTGFVGLAVSPNSFACPVGTSMQLRAMATYHDGTQRDETLRASWSSTNTSVATVQTNGSAQPGMLSGVSPGTVEIDDSAFLEVQGRVCALNPDCFQDFGGGGGGPITQVEITTADIVQDKIVVTLSPASVSGNLVVSTVGAGPNPAIFNGNASGGTYTYSFGRLGLQAGDYSAVNATWTVNGMVNSVNGPVGFNVLGLFRHSQYNTPNESACVGSPSKAYITNASCSFSQNTLKSDFISRTNLNGSGISLNFDIVQKEALCLSQGPPDDMGISFRGFSTIIPSCGSQFSVSPSTVAVDPAQKGSGLTYQCGDQLLLITANNTNQAVKTVTDDCPACKGQFNGTRGHIDDYTTSPACDPHSIFDLGNFVTIRLR